MKVSKHTILAIFEDPRSRYFGLVNDVLAAATLISIFVIILETVPSLSAYASIFFIVEWMTVSLFTLEYGLRLWATKKKRTYALSFFGIVDLVAILPSFIGIANLTFLKSARVVRIIRFLRLVRLAKLSRMHGKDAEETLGVVGFNILLYASTLTLVILIFGVTLHLFDTTDGRYWSIPEGMFWTFSVFLGGLPTPIPPGTFGTTIFVLAKFSGMALFGLLVGVIGKVFNELILGKGK